MRRMFLNDKWTSKKGSIVNKRNGDEEEEEDGGGGEVRGGGGGRILKRMILRDYDHIVNT